MRALRIACLIAVALGWHGPASGETTRADVLPLLQGYEWEASKERFSRLEGDAWQVLLDIAGDDTVAGFIRNRAGAALVLYPNDEVWDFYNGRLVSADNETARRRITDAICATFVDDRSAEVEEVMKPLLNARDAHLRTRAALCLKRLDSESARKALQDYRHRIGASWEEDAAFGSAP